MDKKEAGYIQIDETFYMEKKKVPKEEELKAFCTSPVCCTTYRETARVEKFVSLQTDQCPDCNYYLFWWSPQSNNNLY